MSGLSARATSRRTVLRGAALAGAAALGAAACSGVGGARPSATPTAPVDLGAPDGIPVGGAKLYRDDRLVVYRAAEGQFKAFSAVCTHEGCVLADVVRTTGECTCHGSRFDVTTGKVLQGPATKPLPAVPVRASGGRLVAGPDTAAAPSAGASPAGASTPGADGASSGA